MRPATDIPESVMEEAVAWFGEVAHHDDSPDDVQRREFVAWLMRSPVNIEAFLSVSAVHTGLSTATKKNASWLDDLLTDDPSNIVPLAQSRSGDGGQAKAISAERSASRPWRWASRKMAGAAAGVLLATAIGSVALWPFSSTDSERYVTALGEQRTVVLEDGSVMQINTDSAVEVRYGTAAREVVLIQGEAIFDVEEEPARPFRVRSGSVTVVAVGTRFNVYRQAEQTIVTVVEGRVKVQQSGSGVPSTPVRGDVADTPEDAPSAGDTAGPVEVGAGERVSIRYDGAIADTGRVDAERATAWTERRLMFDDDSLAAIVNEFNRYNRSKLVITDIALRERRMSGIFNVDEPEAFVEVLATMTPIRVVERADGTLEIAGAERSASPAR